MFPGEFHVETVAARFSNYGTNQHHYRPPLSSIPANAGADAEAISDHVPIECGLLESPLCHHVSLCTLYHCSSVVCFPPSSIPFFNGSWALLRHLADPMELGKMVFSAKNSTPPTPHPQYNRLDEGYSFTFFPQVDNYL
ncbi:hypothetical protein SKAU_G00167250 [Synaphobranchus kaupii]|uniref:Uncharacterized protein n=1 Tax=Synaphobranchus kaupii TaxID=118154 RepID=A0A9Q1FK90_SYNKA|nr:hypothetical protein SKAU_G00167250 [Synaphobranchus kaupii]